MKKTTILLGMLSISMVYAQATSTAATPPQGKVGVNTENPTEIFHVEGTARVKELPESGENKIYTSANGATGSATKTETFTPTKTVVADANGVLGSIPYVLPEGDADNTALRWDNGTKKWVKARVGNVRPTTYEGANGVTVADKAGVQNTKVISIPAPTEAPDGKVLTWDAATTSWVGKKPDKSPWVKTADKNTPATFTNNDANILFSGRVNVGSSSIDTTVSDKGILTLHGTDNQLLLRSGDNNKHWNVGTNADWFRIRHYANKAGLANSPVYNFILKETGSMMLSGGTGPNAMTENGGNAGFFYEANGSWVGIHRTTNDRVLEMRANLTEQNKKRGMYFEYFRGQGTGISEGTSAKVGFLDSSNDHFTIDNWTGGDINLHMTGNDKKVSVRGKVQIQNIPDKNDATHVLVEGTDKIVSRRTISSIAPSYTAGNGINIANNRISMINGTSENPILRWNGTTWAASKFDNIYTIDGTINEDRTVTQASGTFNFVKNGGGTVMALKSNGNHALHLDFFKGGTNRSAHIGFGSSRDNKFWINNEAENGDIYINAKNIFLETNNSGSDNENLTTVTGQLKVLNIQQGQRGDAILVGNSNIVKYLTLNDILPQARDGQVLKYNGGSWVAGDAASGGPWTVENSNNVATTKNQNMYVSGKVGIGDFSNSTISSDNNVKLHVKGITLSNSFRGAHGADIFPDYVFQKYYTGTSSIKADYNFQSLSQVEDFVKANGHLPGYKSAEAIKKAGYIDVMETQLTNVEKIEELYLHLMEKEKEVKALESKNADLEARLERVGV